MDIIIRMNFVNILECYRMEQDILQILEFNEIRRMLAQLCPSSLSKAKAMDLQPSSEPRIIAEHGRGFNLFAKRDIITLGRDL